MADGLPLYAISAAISTIAAIPADDLPGWWTFYMILGGPFLGMCSTIFIFATAASQRRHGSASQGLALFGYLAGFGQAVSTLSLFFPAGPMSLTGWYTLILGLGLFTIWIIATSIWLIRAPAAAAT